MSKLAGAKEQLELEHSEQSEAEEGSQGVWTLFLLRERRRIRVFLDGVSTFGKGQQNLHFKQQIFLILQIPASTAGDVRPQSRTSPCLDYGASAARSLASCGRLLTYPVRPPIALMRKFLDFDNLLAGIFEDPSASLRVSEKHCIDSISEEAIEDRVPLTEYELASLLFRWNSV
jgi:hypothetical protein